MKLHVFAKEPVPTFVLICNFSVLIDIESAGELDLASDWLKQAIYEEVSRGVKLRERKFGSPSNFTAKHSKPPLPARVVYKDRRLVGTYLPSSR